ncbi:PKD domain-containing protein, partial [Bizionia paragorgiae]|uniref:PKD domain-containing protein n=1 Tax=Bizionia paragorgiae TaxID=283786 RepID=UPI00299D1C2F
MKNITLLVLILFSSFAFSQDILMQNGTFTQCSGTFYDSGGPSASYSNNEDFTMTICPDQPNSVSELDFSGFPYSTQSNAEFLTIYDGDDTTAPVIGTFTGGGASANPGFITASATNPTGCLTITFTSDGSGSGSGWGAAISCFEPCQTITAVLDSTVPALNIDGDVEADPNETITFNGSGIFSGSGAGATYTWDFGDGNTATGQTVTHSYPNAGIYQVTLTITDTNPNGCSSTNDIDLTAIIGASSPGNPNVDAGDDLTVDCTTGCVELNASYLDIGLTNTYNVNQIAFVPPFPFSGLTNSINLTNDDRWAPVESLPFDFCFFGGVETQFQVGSNGVIRFDVDPGDTSNGWSFDVDLPSNTPDALGEANILTPVHDILPQSSGTNEIAWEIIGAAPNRVLAVTYYEVRMFGGSCSTLFATHMAVMYETTNVIDIYIKDKPVCSSWNSGNAALGIQNDAGTTAFVPPGRNTSDSPWTATDEAWRFTPAGPSVVTFAWLDEAGTVISTDPNFTVCPTVDTTYTAEVTYTNCNGDVVVVTDDVTVFVPFTVDLGADQNHCVGDPDVVLDATVTTTGATYQWTLDGVDIAGETNPTLTVASPNSGTYGVSVIGAGCTVTDEVVITFSDSDPSFTVLPSCTGGTVDTVATTGGVFSFNPAPTDAAVIDVNTGEVTNATPGATYTIEYNTLGTCPGITTQDLTVLPADDASFTMLASCTGGTVDTVVMPGGTFSFNPAPTDAAVIDPSTGEVTNATYGATYTVEYLTNGACPETGQFNLVIPTLDDPSFTVLATCDGAVVDTVTTPGGTFTLNPVPTDGTVIDPATGEVTGGTSNTSYTIEYTTNGTCPDSSTQAFVVNTTEDASFTMVATCDGGTVDTFATAGGTYAFNPVPTDAAVIDPATGAVTGGTPGATYVVEYSFGGTCPTFTTFDL